MFLLQMVLPSDRSVVLVLGFILAESLSCGSFCSTCSCFVPSDVYGRDDQMSGRCCPGCSSYTDMPQYKGFSQ